MSDGKCPFCGTAFTHDMEDAQVCFGCGKSFSEMRKQAEVERAEELERAAAQKREERRKREETIAKNRANFLLSTGYNFEGYKIKKYLGIVHGECVLGTGFLSDVSASINDFLGTGSDRVSQKISYAKQKVQDEMMMDALGKGANAIIGVDFDVSSIYSNMIMVSSNATAVFVEDAGSDRQ